VHAHFVEAHEVVIAANTEVQGLQAGGDVVVDNGLGNHPAQTQPSGVGVDHDLVDLGSVREHGRGIPLPGSRTLDDASDRSDAQRGVVSGNVDENGVDPSASFFLARGVQPADRSLPSGYGVDDTVELCVELLGRPVGPAKVDGGHRCSFAAAAIRRPRPGADGSDGSPRI
jgi:hypothetical protein